MKWVTRARPKVDRVACPWLIKRFVDPAAEFLYVPTDQVMEVAKREGAIPFDVANVELGHNGPECSFDAIIKKYNLTDRSASATCTDRQRGRYRSEGPNAGVTRIGGDRRRVFDWSTRTITSCSNESRLFMTRCMPIASKRLSKTH